MRSFFAGDKDHVAADGWAQRALHQNRGGKVVVVGDLPVRFIRELVNTQEAPAGVEGAVASVAVGEVGGGIVERREFDRVHP